MKNSMERGGDSVSLGGELSCSTPGHNYLDAHVHFIGSHACDNCSIRLISDLLRHLIFFLLDWVCRN